MAEKKQKDMKYAEAMEELQEIVQAMEQGEIDVDDLSAKVSRAAVLIKFCRQMLKATSKEVDTLLREFEQEDE